MRFPFRLRPTFASLSLLLFALPCVHAQEMAPTGAPPHPAGLFHSVLASLVFGLTGIILAIVGFKLFDLVTPFNLEKEMCENKNLAVGVLCGAIVLGICHIIAASMS
jgi:putative membrane protein